MRLRFRSAPTHPIAIDLGWSSTKLLQLGDGRIEAAASFTMGDACGDDVDARLGMLAQELPDALEAGAFMGRRVVIAMPSFATLLQSMHLDQSTDADAEVTMQSRLPDIGDAWMVRAIDVSAGGEATREVICQAIPRGLVLRHIELLHAMKLDVVGIVAQPAPIVAAFDHVTRRTDDAGVCTLHVDIGAGGTRVVMAHGRTIVLARGIAVGGKHFDARVADVLQCDRTHARDHRLQATVQPSTDTARASNEASASEPPTKAMLAMERRMGDTSPSLGPDLEGMPVQGATVDVSVLLETLVDDLRLCLRQHAATWPDTPVSRVVFTGGEARHPWLCRDIVQAIGLPGQIGDPLACLDASNVCDVPEDWADRAKPDWAVAAGLAALHGRTSSKATPGGVLRGLTRLASSAGVTHVD